MLNAGVGPWKSFLDHEEAFKNKGIKVSHPAVGTMPLNEPVQKMFYYVIKWFELFEHTHGRPAVINRDFTKQVHEYWEGELEFVIHFVTEVLPETSTFSLSTRQMYYAEL